MEFLSYVLVLAVFIGFPFAMIKLVAYWQQSADRRVDAMAFGMLSLTTSELLDLRDSWFDGKAMSEAKIETLKAITAALSKKPDAAGEIAKRKEAAERSSKVMTSELSNFLSESLSISRAYFSATDVFERELGINMDWPQASRDRLINLCQMLNGAKHDLSTEIDEVSVCWRDVGPLTLQERVDRIERWVKEDLKKINAVVEYFNAFAPGSRQSLIHLLITDEALGLFKIFERLTTAAKAVREAE